MSKAHTPALVFVAAAAPLGLFLGFMTHVIYTTQPPAEPSIADESPPPQTPLHYQEMKEPISLGLYGGRIQLTLHIGFTTYLKGTDLLVLAGEIEKRRATLIASITRAILAQTEGITQTEGLSHHLHETLPDVLRTLLNAQLAPTDFEAPIAEVLVLDMSIAPG